MKKKWLSFILIPFLLFYSLPAGAEKKEERKWQDETFYFIMIDRFNNSDFTNDFKVDMDDPKAYHGGDFQGIIDQLDYIKDMGFTALWLTPIFDNAEKGYHGYWVNDFYQTEEHFGTMEKFKELVNEAHKRDIKIVLDFVVNHVSPDHPWLTDASKSDWFHEEKEILNWEDQDELNNGWIYGLPDLNTENPDVYNYLVEAAKWWITETNIDGYRLDTVRHVPLNFWETFSKEVKSVKDNFYLLGEVWDNDPNYIAQYDQAGIDGFVDYPLNEHLRTAFAKPNQSLYWLFETASRNKTIYEDPYLMGTFMDNHDTPRFTRDAVQNNEHPGPRWKLALTYLYTTPGIPIVYYGSEIALDGGEDPDNRRQMDFRTDKELVEYISQIGAARQAFPSLTRGSFEFLYEEKGMAVYKREYKEETTIVALNNTTKTQTVTISEGIKEDRELRGVLSDEIIRAKGSEYTFVVDRDQAQIYTLGPKTGLNIPYLLAMGAVYLAFIIFIYLLWKRSKRKKLPNE